MDVEVFTLNAFSSGPNGGNPAGVVFGGDTLKTNEMQEIARLVGFSETAFVQKSKVADYKVSYFTPNAEVDLCGHATIATFYLMSLQKKIGYGVYKIETGAGVLEIMAEEGNRIFLSQALPVFSDQPDRNEIADSLNIPISMLDEKLPVEVVSTGLRDIFVPIKNQNALNRLVPDFKKIAQVSQKYKTIGYHLFTLDAEQGVMAYCRNFAPLYDIPEESATGTSNGALTCYLHKYKKIANPSVQPYILRQGDSMNRPSTIFTKIKWSGDHIQKIEAGGTASNIQKRLLSLS